ncbi:MAG: hypothetical protein EOP45_10690 [Sphingobacteriaceae bacterium]|nr:MAG: hypothetical protein EOP45_10690 [Sphingobacteriaceae bacterium]
MSEVITIERAKHFNSPVLQKKSEDLTKEINTDKTLRDKLLVNDKDQLKGALKEKMSRRMRDCRGGWGKA